MKSYVVISIYCVYFLTTVRAVPVDTVVEQEKDAVQNDTTKALLDNIDQDCHQPREIGRCFALFNRYAFNAESLKCEEFIYGGCGGNNNNFETLEECEKKCSTNKEDHTESSVNNDKRDNEDDIGKDTEKESKNVTEIIPNDKST